MCIIVAKPMNVEMPSEQVLRNCFVSNPDGAGFMFADGKNVRIRKGFMKFEDFLNALHEETEGFDLTETALVMHFRIATHGKVQPMCCHPFPVSDEPEKIRATRTESRFGVAHNGIISGRFTNDKWSDTMDFVAEVIAPLAKMNSGFMFNDHALDLLEGACRSKLAIMNHAGDLVTVGDFKEDGGVLYSNTTYLSSWSRYSSYGAVWNEWDRAYGSTYGGLYSEETGMYGESMEELVAQLPFGACQDCPVQEECALNYPYCESEHEAEDTCLEELGLLDEMKFDYEKALAVLDK